MKKFKFKFQTVLEHKRRIEEGFKDELVILSRELADKNLLIGRLRQRLLDSQRRWLDHKVESKSAGLALIYQQYFLKLQYRIIEEQQLRESILEKVEAKRQQYIAAQKEMKTIEKLEEKEYRDYQYLLGRSEQALMDEAARSGFIRQQKQKK